MRTFNIKSSIDKCAFRQSNVHRLLPASNHCRVQGNQIVEHSSDNETVGSWEEPPNIIFGIYLIIIVPTKKE